MPDTDPFRGVIEVACWPSHRDALLNVVVEASSGGHQVMTTDATGCRNAVVHGKTGLTTRLGRFRRSRRPCL